MPTAHDHHHVSSRFLLDAVVQVHHGWLVQLPPDDGQRSTILLLVSFIDDRVKQADYSTATMMTARAILCINCSGIHPSLAKACGGQSLEQCCLLKRLT